MGHQRGLRLGRRRIQERLNAKAGRGSVPKVEVLERGFNGFYQVRCLTIGDSCVAGNKRGGLRSIQPLSAVRNSLHDEIVGAALICRPINLLRDFAMVMVWSEWSAAASVRCLSTI